MTSLRSASALASTPIPGISTSIVTPGRIGIAPVDVPQAMTSPGSSVMSREMRLTSCRGEKNMSLTG